MLHFQLRTVKKLLVKISFYSCYIFNKNECLFYQFICHFNPSPINFVNNTCNSELISQTSNVCIPDR